MNQVGLIEPAMEIVSCPCCKSDQNRFWAQENGYEAVKCLDCGMVYVRERPPLAEVSEAVREGVHRLDDGTLDVRTAWSGRKVSYYGSIIREFFPSAPATWLDVGAGNGEVVAAINRTFPDTVALGVEPMRTKVAVAKERGISVQQGLLRDVRGKFDVISLFNVFSHLPDVDAFLEEVRQRLASRGTVFLETGNAADLASRAEYPDPLYLPDHLTFAGEGHIRRILERHGFGHIYIASRPIDTPAWAVKAAVKAVLKGRPKIALPYRSPFRTMFVRAE